MGGVSEIGPIKVRSFVWLSRPGFSFEPSLRAGRRFSRQPHLNHYDGRRICEERRRRSERTTLGSHGGNSRPRSRYFGGQQPTFMGEFQMEVRYTMAIYIVCRQGIACWSRSFLRTCLCSFFSTLPGQTCCALLLMLVTLFE